MRKIISLLICFTLLFTTISIAFADNNPTKAEIKQYQQTEVKKLELSQENKKFLGVCGGLADYFNIDPVLVRAGFIILTLCSGIGIVSYFVMYFVME